MNIIEIMNRWPTQETALTHLEKVRWNGRPVCPYCKSDKACIHASKDKSLPRWQCQDCHRAFSVTVGTIFHHTHLPLQTWFLAIAIMLNAEKNVSNAQLARDLKLPYKTAWSLTLRIRTAMLTDPAQKQLFQGIVEMDESDVGYGQHHHYSDKWAGYYISETAYKYNHRENGNLFHDLVSHMVGIAA